MSIHPVLGHRRPLNKVSSGYYVFHRNAPIRALMQLRDNHVALGTNLKSDGDVSQHLSGAGFTKSLRKTFKTIGKVAAVAAPVIAIGAAGVAATRPSPQFRGVTDTSGQKFPLPTTGVPARVVRTPQPSSSAARLKIGGPKFAKIGSGFGVGVDPRASRALAQAIAKAKADPQSTMNKLKEKGLHPDQEHGEEGAGFRKSIKKIAKIAGIGALGLSAAAPLVAGLAGLSTNRTDPRDTRVTMTRPEQSRPIVDTTSPGFTLTNDPIKQAGIGSGLISGGTLKIPGGLKKDPKEVKDKEKCSHSRCHLHGSCGCKPVNRAKGGFIQSFR